jgi:hypothetical protein
MSAATTAARARRDASDDETTEVQDARMPTQGRREAVDQGVRVLRRMLRAAVVCGSVAVSPTGWLLEEGR